MAGILEYRPLAALGCFRFRLHAFFAHGFKLVACPVHRYPPLQISAWTSLIGFGWLVIAGVILELMTL